MRNEIIFVDVDNTLYDWPNFFAPSFRAMVHALQRALDVPEDQLYQEFKAVFAAHQSLEYAFSIQELESVRSLPKDRIRYLIEQGRGAFLRVQRHRLRPYPGVQETLAWLLEQGHVAVAVTNSPLFLAQKRLYDLRLDGLLAGLVAWEGFDPVANSLTEGFVPQSRQRAQSRLKGKSLAIPLASCKPSKEHYAIALDAFAKPGAEAWAIGDSLTKDLEPASRLGIRTIWARYGSGHDPSEKDAGTLLRITHWDHAEIQRTYSKDAFEPDIAIDSFDELKRIIPANILTLF